MPKRPSKEDYDALVFQKKEDDEVHANHVRKKDKRQGTEVVFDPAQHKEFITGFRKRKQQRRKEAQEQLKEKERQQRIASRAEKRSKLKEELGLGDNWGASSAEDNDDGGQQGQPDSEDEAQAPGAQTMVKDGHVVVYQQQGLMTTVTTMPFGDEPILQEDSPEEDGGAHHNKPKQHWQKQVKGAVQKPKGVPKKQHQPKKSSRARRQSGSGKKKGGNRNKGKAGKGRGY